MESHAFRIEIYKPQTRIVTPKQGLRRDETGVINQSGDECKSLKILFPKCDPVVACFVHQTIISIKRDRH